MNPLTIGNSLDLLSTLDLADVLNLFNYKMFADDDLLVVVSAGFLNV